MPKEPSPDVQELARLLLLQPTRGGGRGRRSPLFWWMLKRADELKPIFERNRTIWANVAVALPDTEEIRDGSGKRPSGERVRKTWIEVQQAKGWMQKPEKPAKAPKPLPITPTDATSQPPSKPPEPATEPSDDEEEIEMTVASGKVFTVRIPKR